MAKRMETFVDMAGAFIVFALHWSIVEWANCAGWMRLWISVASDWAHFPALVWND